MIDCPLCGEPTENLVEGFCQECYDDRQMTLDLFNAEFDRWEKMSDSERNFAIKRGS